MPSNNDGIDGNLGLLNPGQRKQVGLLLVGKLIAAPREEIPILHRLISNGLREEEEDMRTMAKRVSKRLGESLTWKWDFGCLLTPKREN